jgi:septal ring factor EnvC (AmiA/AmiB activator)
MTDTAFRIPFDAKAGATIKQTVTTQWPREEEQGLVDLPIDLVLAYASNEGLTPAQRAAFNRMADMKRSIEALDRQIENETEARDRVFEDQERIRENIKAVPAGSDLQSRYLRSMGQLEDQAESHNRNITRLQQQRAAEQQRLADYVAGLQL